MKITLEEIEKIATLARIALSNEEKEQLSNELTNILNYVEKINELDTTNVKPTAHILDIHNVFREDVVTPGMPTDDIIKLAPKSKDNFIVVPKVL
ncbi:MAG: Asp-tRNA(Asn)/Glu-tRNA(Gln) amidotransferase subunit GatC [Spirochaetota bacterium]|nr:Asp-tRNA(Asn)/Glu-tRNA(Gln) amidotransferase subunit GatC [Spirochaetota bacterium]